MRQRLPPALALFLIAPIFGELFSGSAPLNEYLQPVTLITLSLLYGCGAIIVRELVVRWEKGWLSLLLLGFAYGIYEEGLMVQSFFDPTWMDLGSLAAYGRVAGVNWIWSLHLTIYHALISIAASIAFTEMLYPERRRERWVLSRFWWLANWAGFIAIYLVWEVLTLYDPGVWKLLSWLAVLALGVLARLAPANPLAPRSRLPAPAWRFFALGFLGYLEQFFIIYNGADNWAYPYQVAILLVLGFDLLLLWLALRWSGNGSSWDDRQRMALVTGGLSFFLVFGPLTSGAQYPILYFTNPIFLFLLWLAARRVRLRVENAPVRVGQPALE